MKHYNEQRPHSGKYCYGKTPIQTFHDTLQVAKEKILGFEFPSSEPAVGRSLHTERSEPGRPAPSDHKDNAVAFVGEA